MVGVKVSGSDGKQSGRSKGVWRTSDPDDSSFDKQTQLIASKYFVPQAAKNPSLGV